MNLVFIGIISFLVGFAMGIGAARVYDLVVRKWFSGEVSQIDFNFVADNYLRVFITPVIVIVWLACMIKSLADPSFTVNPLLYALIGAIIGSLYGKPLIKGVRNAVIESAKKDTD